jgi:signal transduction histidine kinase
MRCRATVTRANIQLNDAATTAVFRILEEALTNIVRHAKATDVVVTLAAADGTLTLTVGDNGAGITPGAVWGPRSLGLLGIRERARGVGGDVTIDGAPGRGTRLTLRLPIDAAAAAGSPL